MKRLIRYERPKEKDSNLCRAWFDFGTGKEILSYMTKDSLEIEILRQKLVDKGYSEKDLDNFYDLVYSYAYSEAERNFNDY